MSSRSHIAALDGIRGIAILGVMLFHFWSPSDRSSSFVEASYQLAQRGSLGVMLFFALSGFLITRILDSARDDARYFRNFYARRALRIFPLYYGALVLLLVLVPLVHMPSDPKYRFTVDHQAWLWIYASNFFEAHTGRAMPLVGHFWTLAIEEQFYLVWPFVMYRLKPRGALVACAVAVLVAFAVRYHLFATGLETGDGVALRITPCQVDTLAMGCALALWLRDRPATSLRTTAVVAGGVSAAFLVAAVYGQGAFLHPAARALQHTAWSVVMTSALLLGMGAFGLALSRPFTASWLTFLGKYSYGLYVIHWPVGRLLLAAFPAWASTPSVAGFALFVAVEIGVSLVVALASWHLYEKHFLKLKKFFEYQPSVSVAPRARGAGEAFAPSTGSTVAETVAGPAAE